MNDRFAPIESTLQRLERQVGAIEHRLAALEGRTVPVPPPGGSEANGLVPDPTAIAAFTPEHAISILSLVGRTFVALGGGYFLRALTDSAKVPPSTGVALGLAYAVFWWVMADIAGGRQRTLSAAFHGLVAAMIAFPLTWEATVRFATFGPGSSAVVLASITALGLGVAIHGRLQPVAWIAIAGGLPTAAALIGATGAFAPYSAYLVALGIATLWIGYTYDWIGLRWPVALFADVAVLGLTLRIGSREAAEPLPLVLGMQMLLLNGYLASVVSRTLFRSRDVIPFEVIQTLAVLAVGFGGAVYATRVAGAGAVLLALINLAFAVGCYATAFAFVARRQAVRLNFHFYSLLGLILVLVSAGLLLDRSAFALVCATLSVLSMWTARRVDRGTLNVHGVVYLTSAAVASGLLTAAGSALAGSVDTPWPAFQGPALLTLAAIGACSAIGAPPSAGSSVHFRLPQAVVTALLLWSGSGLLVSLVTARLSVPPGGGADAGMIATIRTTILAAAAVTAAWWGRAARYRESAWFMYPLLLAGGVKLLVDDLPHSNASTLFVSLALYGLALIAGPRLARHRTA